MIHSGAIPISFGSLHGGIEATCDVHRDAFGYHGVGERSGSRRQFARGV